MGLIKLLLVMGGVGLLLTGSVAVRLKQSSKNRVFFVPGVSVRQDSHAKSTLPLVTPDG